MTNPRLVQHFHPPNYEGEIRVLALQKASETYVWLYDDATLPDALRTIVRFAANPELSLTWWDADYLAKVILANGMS